MTLAAVAAAGSKSGVAATRFQSVDTCTVIVSLHRVNHSVGMCSISPAVLPPHLEFAHARASFHIKSYRHTKSELKIVLPVKGCVIKVSPAAPPPAAARPPAPPHSWCRHQPHRPAPWKCLQCAQKGQANINKFVHKRDTCKRYKGCACRPAPWRCMRASDSKTILRIRL